MRNLGREGLAATAISAVDAALYDLKARLLDLPLVRLLGSYRSSVPIYGSGGFTSYSDDELENQLAGWVSDDGCAFVKMKIGSHPERRSAACRTWRSARSATRQLFVDANGAYAVQQALSLADAFAEQNVGWFEEPVSSDDLAGLAAIRAADPGRNGDRGRRICLHRRLCAQNAGGAAVDVQQADVTRCGGVTAFLQIAALCEAFHVDLSGHCAPALHLHVACAAPRLRHLEWFHDHVRIEHMLFDGAPVPSEGPDPARSVAARKWTDLQRAGRRALCGVGNGNEQANEATATQIALGLATIAAGSLLLDRRPLERRPESHARGIPQSRLAARPSNHPPR